jgi:hypothetical protein
MAPEESQGVFHIFWADGVELLSAFSTLSAPEWRMGWSLFADFSHFKSVEFQDPPSLFSLNVTVTDVVLQGGRVVCAFDRNEGREKLIFHSPMCRLIFPDGMSAAIGCDGSDIPGRITAVLHGVTSDPLLHGTLARRRVQALEGPVAGEPVGKRRQSVFFTFDWLGGGSGGFAPTRNLRAARRFEILEKAVAWQFQLGAMHLPEGAC